MHADGENLEAAACEGERLIKEHCHKERLDLVYLGIGDDGHTASLFPNTQALTENKKLVVPNYVLEKDTWRMTFTFRAINDARHTDVLVFGASKATILKEILQSPTLPAAQVGSKKKPALFIVDKEAASLIDLKSL